MKEPGVIDFHAHILPNADHGSDGIATSLLQLASAAAAGVTTVVATPHFYPDRHRAEEFLARRTNCAQRLAQSYHGDIYILPGAEVLLCQGLAHLPQLPALCIKGTNTLLIEMPMTAWSQRHIEALEELREMHQFTVVLAHVDRYSPKDVETLLARGFLGQLNAESLCRYMGRRRLLQWVREDKIVALGSDIHGTSRAYRKFQRAYTRLGQDGANLMSRTQHLLACEGIPAI